MPLFPAVIIPTPPIISNDAVVYGSVLTVTLTANAVNLYAFSLPSFTTITGVRWRMGATTTGHTNMAVYTLAGNLVTGSDTGAQLNTASAANNFTYGTALGLAAGLYYLALACDNATDTYEGTSLGASQSELTTYRLAANALAAGVMPATTGAISFNAKQPSMSALISGGLA